MSTRHRYRPPTAIQRTLDQIDRNINGLEQQAHDIDVRIGTYRELRMSVETFQSEEKRTK